MTDKLFYVGGSTAAVGFAAGFLAENGAVLLSEPVNNTDYLLLDVPAFGPDGQLRGGGEIRDLLKDMSSDTVILGGRLNHPALDGYKKLDLLEDPFYLAENAYITAECALDAALPYLKITIRACPVLVIGWGRIGKSLSSLLKALDADVTVAARKETDRAMLRALGYRTVDTSFPRDVLSRYRLIFNTAPEPVLTERQMQGCHPECVAIDLASKPGMFGDQVITATGLPALHFPESSGKLIADTILRKENLL